MNRVIWALSAQNDILDVAEYYDAIDPSLADDIVSRLEQSVLPLTDFPRLGISLPDRPEVRKWTVTGTPFIVFYVLADDGIEVRRVIHAASDWKR